MTPPYDEALSLEWARLSDQLYAEAHRVPDGGQVIFGMRAAFDFYTGRLSWPESREKHARELREALGIGPVPQPPPGVALPDLVVRGHCFELVTGERWTAIECSDFNLFARYSNGEDLAPVLAQRHEYGFNLLRVWTLFDIPNIGTLTSCPYDQIPAFVERCASYGLYVELTAYTGINDPNHWPRLHEMALACSPRPLLELANEWDIHEADVDSLGRRQNIRQYSKAPAPLLSCHGSAGAEAQSTLDKWDYCDFHTNGAVEEQRKIGHNAMEIWGGPTLTNETSRCPEVGMWRGADPARTAALAFDSAAGAALLCAGSCFHSVHGKTSELWDDVEGSAAMAWANGAKSVDLECQDGPYMHRADLEEPRDSRGVGQYLRVYERRVAGHDGIVRIRN